MPSMPESSFEEIIERDGKLVYTNRGFSMYPLIRQHRDLLVISKKPKERLKKYDVVLFKRNNKYILHRIIAVNENSYDTTGDHNWWKEKDVRDEEIIGVLTSLVRDGKEISTDDPKYHMYVRAWYGICYPARNVIMKTRSQVKKLLKR